jgi:hypothetical protein
VLLRRDVTEFDKTSPPANRAPRAVHTPATVVGQSQSAAPAAAAVAAAQPEPAAPAARKQPLTIFGAPGSSERHGWVAISRKEKAEGAWVVNFTGYAISETSLPPAGTVLTAQRNVPVWSELQSGTTNDQSKLQNRLPPGGCVRVIATRAGPVRLWAEVAPASCS